MKGKHLLKSITLLLLLLSFFNVNNVVTAQESFGGLPASFSVGKTALRNELAPNLLHIMPNFNPADEVIQNNWDVNEVHTKPLIIGKVIPTDIDFIKEAKQSVLEDGRTIYRLSLKTKGSYGVTLYYKDFYIPENAGALYIYTPDREQVLGKYTYATHPQHGKFATEPLHGDEVILEYVCGIGAEKVVPTIQIEGLLYIFRPVLGLKKETPRVEDDPGEDSSNPACTVNVNCPDGNEWQTEKTGVVQIVMKFGRYAAICSGNLVNNTMRDFKPLILTAGHCVGDEDRPTLHPNIAWSQFIFTFHYEEPGCSDAGFALNNKKSLVGCEPLAFLPIQKYSDGALLKISRDIPEAFRVYYSGWDRGPQIPKSVVGIHHPAGDSKKISVNRGGIQIGTWNGNVGGKNDHFLFSYSNQSNTEGGSSGSPLWDQNHYQVGTLSGGSPGCAGYNLYGRLSSHWDKYKDKPDFTSGAYTIKPRVDIFLDPKDNGLTQKLEGAWRSENAKFLDPVKNIKIGYGKDKKTIEVTWDAVDKSKIPSNWTVKYKIYRNGKLLGSNTDTESTMFSEPIENVNADQLAEGMVYYGVQARYLFNGIKIPNDGYNGGKDYSYADASVTTQGAYLGKLVKEIVPEVKQGTQGVELKWSSPIYLQEISNFGYPDNINLGAAKMPRAMYVVGSNYEAGSRAVAATKMHVEGFENGGSVYLHAISFIPETRLNDVRIFARSGAPIQKNLYFEQADIPSNWKVGEWVTIRLKKPLAIDPFRTTYIGISIPNASSPQGKEALMFVKGSIDKECPYRDYVISGDNGKTFNTYDQYGFNKNGYAAIRAIYGSSSTAVPKDTEYEFYSKSKYPAPFPKVIGYNLYRNGEKINTNLIKTLFSNDMSSGASTGASYKVEPVYDESTVLAIEQVAEERASVYPTRIGQDATLYVNGVDTINAINIYSVDGKLVQKIEHPQGKIDVSDLSSGTYLVVLETYNGNISQRIFR